MVRESHSRSPRSRRRRRSGGHSACAGSMFAWAARERDGGGLGVRVDREEKQLILDANPDVYFSSPHYDGWPGVQIRLELIDRDELRDRLEDAWLIQAPKPPPPPRVGARAPRRPARRARAGA